MSVVKSTNFADKAGSVVTRDFLPSAALWRRTAPIPVTTLLKRYTALEESIMRRILCLAMAFFFAASFAHGVSDEKISTFTPFPDQFYVFLLTNSIDYSDDDLALYDGVEFPLYAGYVVIKDHTFTFVKKTPLPVGRLVAYFDDIIKTGSVDPLQSIHKPNENPRVPLTDDMFTAHLHLSMTTYFPGVFLVGFTGEPDENYTPVFEKTCVYRANPRKRCTIAEFDIAPEYYLIPTSNVMKERETYHRGLKGERRLERYDPETKTWEDIGRY